THHSATVVADVPGADVVTPDHQDVRFLLLRRCGAAQQQSAQRDSSEPGHASSSPVQRWTGASPRWAPEPSEGKRQMFLANGPAGAGPGMLTREPRRCKAAQHRDNSCRGIAAATLRAALEVPTMPGPQDPIPDADHESRTVVAAAVPVVPAPGAQDPRAQLQEP